MATPSTSYTADTTVDGIGGDFKIYFSDGFEIYFSDTTSQIIFGDSNAGIFTADTTQATNYTADTTQSTSYTED